MTAKTLALAALASALFLTGCDIVQIKIKHQNASPADVQQTAMLAPPVIRQPVLPEMLVPCRGHVLVPALGMTFVRRNAAPPETGEFLREENISPPYRIIGQGDHLSSEQNPTRLNIEIDRAKRIIGLYCG